MLYVLFLILLCNYGFSSAYQDSPKKPLILTPLIKGGKIQEAQNASKVQYSQFKNVESYAGYSTVDDRYNSNLFFWFFPAILNKEAAPVILWLVGGPGVSTLLDIFAGNGPFELISNTTVRMGKYPLNLNHSVIYIDNPAAVGFSFTENQTYINNQIIVGEHLYQALLQFFLLFPSFRQNDFFVGGISYAGKYVPAVSYTIHKKNPKSSEKINLKGLVIGDGLMDPELQTGYAEYLYQIGLVDSSGRQLIKELESKYLNHIRHKEWNDAFKVMNTFMFTNDSLYKNLTGMKNFNNFLQSDSVYFADFLEQFHYFIQMEDIKAALHVGNISYCFLECKKVFENFAEDIPKSVAMWITELLSNYKVLFYMGQLDVKCAYPLTVNFLQNLDFDENEDYKSAIRHKWYIDDELVGYVKEGGHLMEIFVRNAGHIVHVEKPKWTLDLMTRFTRNLPFY